MSKKIVLVNPPYPAERFPSPPLGLISLGTFLELNGYEVIIEDYVINPYSVERARGLIERFRPDYFGITAATMNVNRAMAISKDYSGIDGSIIILAGGPHVTFDAENILGDNPHIDFIVRGEGELTALELLSGLENNCNLHEIKGISYREGDEIVHNTDRPFISDINILPIPSIEMAEVSKYKALGLPVNMTTSRGCPYKCIFCAGGKMAGHKVRYYNVSRVVDEFELLTKQGTRQINIADDLFTSNEKRCMEICDEIIRRGIVYPWTAFARVDTVSGNLLSFMKNAGCTTVCFGIESGNQEILDRIKKKTTIEMCRKAIAICKEAGIEPMTSYILGLPGETRETVEKTLAFSRELSSNRGYHILAPFPGTELRDNAEKYGIRILSNKWDEYDTSHSVSESINYAGVEAERVAGEFAKGISKYMESLIKKEKNGDVLTSMESSLVEQAKTFIFVHNVIFNRLIEEYENSRESNFLDHFIGYIAGKTGYNKDDVLYEVNKLFNLNCIKLNIYENKGNISWV